MLFSSHAREDCDRDDDRSGLGDAYRFHYHPAAGAVQEQPDHSRGDEVQVALLQGTTARRREIP